MRIRKGFELREVMGQGIVVACGEASLWFHGMVRLNQTGMVLWRRLQEGADEAQLVRELTERYDVSVAQASADIREVVHALEQAGILE